MLLDFNGHLVNPAHVAHVEPFVPGGPKALTIVLTSGSRLVMPKGEAADAFYKALRGFHTEFLSELWVTPATVPLPQPTSRATVTLPDPPPDAAGGVKKGRRR